MKWVSFRKIRGQMGLYVSTSWPIMMRTMRWWKGKERIENLNMNIVRGFEDVDVKEDADELVLIRGGAPLNHIAEWEKHKSSVSSRRKRNIRLCPLPLLMGPVKIMLGGLRLPKR